MADFGPLKGLEIENEVGEPIPVEVVGSGITIDASDLNIGSVAINDATNSGLKATVDSSGSLQVQVSGIIEPLPAGDNNIGNVDVVTMPNVTLASQTNPFTNDINVSLDGETVTLSSQPSPFTDDVKVTLDGEVVVVDFDDEGGLALESTQQTVSQQLTALMETSGIKQIQDPVAVNFTDEGDLNLEVTQQNILTTVDTIVHVSGIKQIQDALPVGDNDIGRVKLTDGTYVVGVTDSGLLQVETTQAPGTQHDVHLVTVSGTDLAVVPETIPPADHRAILFAGIGDQELVHVPNIIVDDEDQLKRLAITGKISVTTPPPPEGGVAVSIDASSPLDVATTESDSYVITSGKTFTIQSVTVGAEGDPNSKGSKVEVYFNDGTDHLISRIYVVGQSVPVFPDTSIARDGTSLTGNGSNVIRIDRTRLGGGTLEIDAVVRGYEI